MTADLWLLLGVGSWLGVSLVCVGFIETENLALRLGLFWFLVCCVIGALATVLKG